MTESTDQTSDRNLAFVEELHLFAAAIVDLGAVILEDAAPAAEGVIEQRLATIRRIRHEIEEMSEAILLGIIDDGVRVLEESGRLRDEAQKAIAQALAGPLGARERLEAIQNVRREVEGMNETTRERIERAGMSDADLRQSQDEATRALDRMRNPTDPTPPAEPRN